MSDTVVKLETKKPKADKGVNFRKIATKRVKKLLKDISLVGNCGDRSRYACSDSERERMFQTIRGAVDTAEARFAPSFRDQDEFSF